MIQVEHLSKSFQNRKAIQDISFEIETGEILGLLGPNGAGKTTTIRILAGYFPPTEGRVLIDGASLFDSGVRLRSKIGYLPENVPLYPHLTTEEFLGFVSDLKGLSGTGKRKAIRDVLDWCDLESVRQRLVGKLSKGFKQRIGLAQALLGDPSFLILDEPTSGLDPKQIMAVRELIRRVSKGKTVLISTHILPEADTLCSRILIMDKGTLVAGGTAGELGTKLRNSSELLLRVRGEAARLEEKFERVRGIIAVRQEHCGGNENEFRIRCRKDNDLRSAISRIVVESNLELLGLSEVPLSLEEIFLKLVVQE